MSKIHLPDDFRRALLAQPGPLCTSVIMNEQAAIIFKAKRAICERLRGPIPIEHRPELGRYPSGAVLRLVIYFHDHPGNHISMDTFFNVVVPGDLRLLHMLAGQPVIVIHFIAEETIDYVFSKEFSHSEENRSELDTMIEMACQHNTTIARVDWPAAKAAMRKDRPL
jgi:hypothetical protein